MSNPESSNGSLPPCGHLNKKGSGRPISLIVPKRSYFSKGSKGNNLGELILKRESTTRRTLERVVAVPVQTYAEYSGFQFTFVDQVDIVGVPESVPFSSA